MKKLLLILSILLFTVLLFFLQRSYKVSDYATRRYMKAVISNQDSLLAVIKNKQIWPRVLDNRNITLVTSNGVSQTTNGYQFMMDENDDGEWHFFGSHIGFIPDNVIGIADPENLAETDIGYLKKHIAATLCFIHSLNVVGFDGVMTSKQKTQGLECSIVLKNSRIVQYIPAFDSVNDEEFKRGYKSVGSGWYLLRQ